MTTLACCKKSFSEQTVSAVEVISEMATPKVTDVKSNGNDDSAGRQDHCISCEPVSQVIS